MFSDRLTIRIESEAQFVDAQDLVDIVDSMLDLLRTLTKSQEGGKESVHWRISEVTLNSPLAVTIFPDTTNVAAAIAVARAVSGLMDLEIGTTSLPKGFDHEALDHAKKLVNPLNHGVQRITLIPDDAPSIVPTQKVAAAVDTLLPKPYDEVGSIEGTLESISIHKHRMFAIWDVFTGRRVECYFPTELFEPARDALGRRVEVVGTIHYNRHGIAESIKVTSLTPLRSQKELPQFADLERLNIRVKGDQHEALGRLWDVH